MGVRLSGDLTIRSGSHRARLHGRDSHLTMDFDSLRSILHLQRQLPRPLPVNGTSGTDPITILVRVRKILVATVTMYAGRFSIRRHWLGMVRSLFTRR